MTSSKENVTFSDLLFLVFVHLKLSNAIDWSWWLVSSPILISLLFILVAAAGKAAANSD